jgi:hypothetical protein
MSELQPRTRRLVTASADKREALPVRGQHRARRGQPADAEPVRLRGEQPAAVHGPDGDEHRRRPSGRTAIVLCRTLRLRTPTSRLHDSNASPNVGPHTSARPDLRRHGLGTGRRRMSGQTGLCVYWRLYGPVLLTWRTVWPRCPEWRWTILRRDLFGRFLGTCKGDGDVHEG